jgi:undecaprenyl-diphosphatase
MSQALQFLSSPALDRVALIMSASTSPIGLGILAGAVVVVLASRRRLREAALVVGTGLAEIATLLLRVVTERPRPNASLIRVVEFAQGTSFPSGHAADAAALAVLLGHLTAHQSLQQRIVAWTGLGLFALAVGTVRIYLGAHWPSDVIGGFLLGAALGLVLGAFPRSR